MSNEVSKTQKKREAEALQQLGVRLCSLSEEKLSHIPLTDSLKQAILTAKTLKSHGAMRRQAQLIGKLMRAADHEAIAAAFEDLLATEKAQTAAFHQLEQWRERLITEGREALTEFISIHHPADVQQLRQLIKKAADERCMQKNTGASKALFRFLKSCC